MKLPIPYLRVAAALSLASGLMIGCQDLLNPDKSASGNTPVEETGTLSLSIRNDSACLGQWHAILDARAAGHPDSVSEAAFLAACVLEGKPGKDSLKPPPVPPALRPDSGLRCKWIVSQIEGGRDSMTVSYRKYCPEDCRKLEATDTASHAKLCRDPEPHPGFPPPPKDSLPPKPRPDDTCAMLHAKLDSVKPGEPGRADLEHAFALRCKEPVPHDTGAVPPPKPPVPPGDTCAMLHAKLDSVKPGEPGRADLEHAFALRCKEPVPHDTGSVPPPPKPAGHDSVCADLKLRLGASVPGTPGRSELEAAFKAECMPALPPPPVINCDSLRLKLAGLDSASVDYVHLAGQIKEHCPAR
jgi:hypothetical protein